MEDTKRESAVRFKEPISSMICSKESLMKMRLLFDKCFSSNDSTF